MNLSPSLRANLLMIKALCFPVGWIIWVFIVGVSLLMIGDLVVWKTGSPVVIILGSILAFLYLFMLITFLPSQMVSMASSKQFYWLENLRQKLAGLMFFCCFLTALFVSIYLAFSENNLRVADSFLALFCVASIFFCSMVVLAKFFSTGQFFIFMFSMLFTSLGKWLMQSNMLISVALLCLVWASFLYWWFQWRSQRYLKSFFGISQAEYVAYYSEQSRNPNFTFSICHAKPKTLVGSILFGFADGFLSQVRRTLSPIIVAVVIVVIGEIFIEGHVFLNALAININFFMLFMLIGFAYTFNVSLFRSLYKTWIFYEGSRSDFSKYIESTYFSSFMVNIVVVLVGFFGLSYVREIPSITMTSMFLMAISSLLLAAVILYVAMVIYCKTKAGVVWSVWINGVICLLFIISFNSGVKFLNFNSHLGITCGIGVAALLVALMLRQWMQVLWRRVDFVRIKA